MGSDASGRDRDSSVSGLTRRAAVSTGLAAVVAPTLPARAADAVVRIGHVSPRTGPLAGFGEADPFILDGIRTLTTSGIDIGGKRHKVEIISKDSQSSPSRASEVASDLINGDKVDLLVASATPDTTNPVADQAEVSEVPCITTNCPWQAYYFGRNPDPKTGFKWTYHFFWGLEDVIGAFVAMWDTLPTNKVVGGMYTNDADGNAWGDAQRGFPPALAKSGYKLIDPGRFQPLTNDYSAQISAFKAANVEILTGVFLPPDFATFWSQAAQQNFRPKIVTVGKALLFPSVVDSLGSRGIGLSNEIWWTPNHPYKSGLSGQSAGDLCAAYTKATGRPWTQPIGFQHALFEVALDVLKRAKSKGPEDILQAITTTDYRSIVGPVHWTGQPVKNVCKTPLVAGQWRRGANGSDLVICENATAPDIPTGGTLQALA